MAEGASEEVEVKIGVRQGSVLSPVMFIAVLDLIIRNTVMKDAVKRGKSWTSSWRGRN